MSTTVRLKDIGTTYSGLTGKTKTDFSGGSASFVTFVEVLNNTRLRGSHLAQVHVRVGERQNRVLRGDLLFNGSSETPEEVALSAVVDYEPDATTYLNSFCFGYRLKTGVEVDPTFLAYFFRSAAGRSLVASLAQGATRYNIAKTKFLEVKLTLPALERQRAVVTTLSEADDLIAAIERLIVKKQAIKHGMMQHLLTGKTRLPGFTEPWRDILLGENVTYVKTVALSRAQLDTSSTLRYLHYGDIHKLSKVRLDAAVAEMPRATRALAGSAGRLRVGDLIFADASEDPAGVGKSVELSSVPADGLIPGLHTIAARFDKSVLADGFKAYLQFIPAFRNSLLRLAAGTKVLATTRSYISSITLALPGVHEQQAIAQALIDSDDEISMLHARLAKAKAVKHGMMQELLTRQTDLQVEETAS